MQKFCKFAYLKPTFSILHFHFYKNIHISWSIVHLFIKILFFLTFYYYFPPTPTSHILLFSLNTLPFLLLVHISISASLSSPSFFFFFLRIFFFPLLLLQFGFYTSIIDDDFGLGLIKGSDFGQRSGGPWRRECRGRGRRHIRRHWRQD